MNYVNQIPKSFEIPKTLYKYRKLDKNSLNSLLCNNVYFSKPEDFNDPYEPDKIFENSAFGKALDKNVKLSGILCLCKEPVSLSMWSYYGAALKGFALGYDANKLIQSVAPTRWKDIYEIYYEPSDITAINTEQIVKCDYNAIDPEKIKMFATKAEIFKHEKEVRIVIEPTPDFDQIGYGLYNHSPESISEIIFGELMCPSDQETIRQALRDRKIIYKKAIRSKNKFEINIVNV